MANPENLGLTIAAERATPLLNSAEDWLTANSNAVMAVMLAVLGARPSATA